MADWLSPEEWQAVALSLRVAFWATLVSLPPGIFVAHALARWRFPGRQLLNGLVHLPLILPPVVTGYLLLATFGRRAPLGQFLEETFGIVFAFRWTGAALAAGIMAFPLMVRAIRLAIEAVDPRLEQAAATLGASRIWVFLTVTLPLILPGVIVGAILAFAKAMGEFGATITFVSNIPGQTQTLLLGHRDIKRKQPGRGRVDRHRGIHLLERDLVEKRPHVAEMGNRHADLAHLSTREHMVAVIPGLGRQIEGHRQPGLPLGEVAAIERVRCPGRGVTGIGPDQPGLVFLGLGHRGGPSREVARVIKFRLAS